MMNEIKSKCKKCGRLAPSTQFVLDCTERMMICPYCIKDKRTGVVKQEMQQLKKEEKPAGWDPEDEYLDKAYKQKMQNAPKVQQLPDGRVKYTCPRCKYSFPYDREKKQPASCPYCSSEILSFRMQ